MIEIILLITGLMTALLLNYLADVLPLTRKLSAPVCLVCTKPLSVGDYFLLRKCNSCGSVRNFRNHLVLILLPALFILAWTFAPSGLPIWLNLLMFSCLVLIGIIDMEHKAILNQVAFAAIAIGFAAGYFLHGLQITLLGGLAGFFIMLFLFYIGQGFVRLISRLKKSAITEEALGFGDVTLAGIMGFILGWPGIVAGLVIAIIIGGLFSATYLVVRLIQHRYQVFTALPYGPFIILGGLVLLYLPG